MILSRFFKIEFFAIFFASLHFYLSNYIGSFNLMGLENSATISQYLAYASLGLAVLLSFMSVWSNRKELLRHGNSYKLVSLAALIIFLLLITQNIGMVLTLPLGIALINTKDKDIFQYILYSNILLYSFTILMYASGTITGGDKIDTALFDNKENIQQLYSLGFNNPNVAYRFFMPILLSALYIFSNHKIIVFLLLMVSVWLAFLTGSTAGLIVALFACIAFALIRYQGFKLIVKKIAPYSFPALTIASFTIALLFGPIGSLPNNVNDALTGRPYLWNARIENGSFLNVIGNNDKYASYSLEDNGASRSYYPLDNMYLYIMVHYGLILYLIYLLAYAKSAKIIRDEKILLVGMSLLVYLTVERSDFISNLYLLLVVKYLVLYYFSREKRDE